MLCPGCAAQLLTPSPVGTCGCGVAATMPNLMRSSIPSFPLINPLSCASNTLPLTASLMSSLNAPTLSICAILAFRACCEEGIAQSPPVQPSPYTMIEGSILSSAARTAFIVPISCTAIRSKRKPSMWYSVAQ